MYRLTFISQNDFESHVAQTIKSYNASLASISLSMFNSNIVDPIKLLFDKSVYDQGDVAQSLVYDHKAREIRERLYAQGKLSNIAGLATTYNNIAYSLKTQGDLEQALVYHHKAREIREKLYEAGKLSNPSVLVKTYTRIAEILESQGDTAQAEIYRRKAQKIQV